MPTSEILVRAARTSGGRLAAADVECSSRVAPWRDLVRLERSRGLPLGEGKVTILWPTVAVIRRGSGILEQQVNGQPLQAFSVSAGSVLVYPEGASGSLRTAELLDSTCLQVAPTLLAAVARDLGQAATLATAWRPGDEPIERVATLLETELCSGCAGGRPYGEYLAHSLATYLLRRYSENRDSAARPARHDKIAGALQYIDAQIMDDLSLSKLSKIAHLSPYHFARRFKQSTGLTPHQYILQRRIDEAKRLLRDTTLDLAEIAQRLGFRDQSHFTARFRKATGMTPKRWRDQS